MQTFAVAYNMYNVLVIQWMVLILGVIGSRKFSTVDNGIAQPVMLDYLF